jgi:hypothetical protein
LSPTGMIATSRTTMILAHARIFVNVSLLCGVLLVMLLAALPAFAQSTPAPSSPPEPDCPNPAHIRVPGEGCVCRWGIFEAPLQQRGYGTGSICDFVDSLGVNSAAGILLNIIVNILTSLVVMAGAASILIGGYIYMTAGGSADRVRTAKIWIGSALVGIALALLAWIILNSIHSSFV